MADCMIFPTTFDEFAEQYKIFDEKEIYTNGTALIPIFRVKQWLEHLTNIVKHGEWIYHECVSSYDGAKSGYSCSVCSAFVNDEVFESDGFHKDFCGHCGADMRGEEK